SVAAASRASRSNSRLIDGSRNCRKWTLSNSIVASAISRLLPGTGKIRPALARRARDRSPRHPSSEGDVALALLGHGVGTDRQRPLGRFALADGTAQQLVEAAQVGPGYLDRRRPLGAGGRERSDARPRLDRGQAARPLDDRFGTDRTIALTGFHGAAHPVQGVLAQELQDPHEPARAGLGAVVSFQLGAERGEAG